MIREVLQLGVALLAMNALAATGAAAATTATTFYPTATFSVPINITNYPAPPAGLDTLTIFCRVGQSNGSGVIGDATRTTIPLTTGPTGSRGYVGTITLTAPKLSPAGKSGDPYYCSIGDIQANPFTLGMNAATSTPALTINGKLP